MPPFIKKPVRRAPTGDEQKQIEAAITRACKRKRPVKVELKGEELGRPHTDKAGHLVALMDAFGSNSLEFMAVNLGMLEGVTRERSEARGDSANGLNAGLALVQAIAPENELEAALAVQIAGTHALATEMLVKAKQTGHVDHLQLYGGLAVKLLRTSTAQIEALARLRGKGQQTVRVEHVTVESGAQAIVGDVHHYRPGGTGDHRQVGVQSDAQQPSDASVAALPCPDAARDGVPLPGHEKRPMSHARRHKSGRPKGK